MIFRCVIIGLGNYIAKQIEINKKKIIIIIVEKWYVYVSSVYTHTVTTCVYFYYRLIRLWLLFIDIFVNVRRRVILTSVIKITKHMPH